MNSEGTKDWLVETQHRYCGCRILMENAKPWMVEKFNRFWVALIDDRNENCGQPIVDNGRDNLGKDVGAPY